MVKSQNKIKNILIIFPLFILLFWNLIFGFSNEKFNTSLSAASCTLGILLIWTILKNGIRAEAIKVLFFILLYIFRKSSGFVPHTTGLFILFSLSYALQAYNKEFFHKKSYWFFYKIININFIFVLIELIFCLSGFNPLVFNKYSRGVSIPDFTLELIDPEKNRVERSELSNFVYYPQSLSFFPQVASTVCILQYILNNKNKNYLKIFDYIKKYLLICINLLLLTKSSAIAILTSFGFSLSNKILAKSKKTKFGILIILLSIITAICTKFFNLIRKESQYSMSYFFEIFLAPFFQFLKQDWISILFGTNFGNSNLTGSELFPVTAVMQEGIVVILLSIYLYKKEIKKIVLFIFSKQNGLFYKKIKTCFLILLLTSLHYPAAFSDSLIFAFFFLILIILGNNNLNHYEKS